MTRALSASAPAPARRVAGLLATYALGAVGGAAARALHVPLPWLLGPLFATGAASLAGAPRSILPASRQLGQAVIGAALGLYFTREVLAVVAGALPWMLAGCAAAVGAGVAGARLLSRRAGLSDATAFFASMPGGAAEMAVLGERAGGDPSVIAVAQALRVLVVVTVVPLALTLAGARGADPWAPAALATNAAGLARLAAGCGAAGLLAHLLRLPNAWLLGSLAASAAVTAGGLGASSVPRPLVDAAQVLMGCALGSRFGRESFRGAGALVTAIVLAIGQGVALLALFAVVLSPASGLSPWTLILATAPGGIAEMCLTARTLQLGVPLVTAFHVLRLVVLLTAAPLAFRAWQRTRAVDPHPKTSRR
ncbi:AbrB family transcriptional regulator [Anaeromyxobacter terrae]|uniref:AbrB family transcriptional regulator n=1 Tax=Anaeromyxobacter terrae TaxID=2925406 RepID=UPI001F577354|nr:AbrB family transcriptional regulator [Anaeromyxobacter sp. SG22]